MHARIAFIAAVLCFTTLTGVTSALAADQPAPDAALQHAKELLRSTPLIDGHNDLPLTVRLNKDAPRDVVAYDLRKTVAEDTDIARLRAGQVGAQFWSVYIEPPVAREEGYAKWQLEQIDIAHQIIEQYPDVFELALTANDIQRIYAEGKIASLLGMEGGYGIENSLGALRSFYRLGVRYMTLTHGATLDWADSATDEPQHDGLSAFGEEVVREMNRLGMLVDLSHVTPATMHDALDVTEAPVIFSHSSARGVADHVRNVPDDVLRRMSDNGGVVMVTFIPSFVSDELREWQAPLYEITVKLPQGEERDRLTEEYTQQHAPKPVATLAQVADHIEYVSKVAGPDHVAIGSDFYGSGDMPEGLEDVSRFPYLIAELVRRGWSDANLKKLIGENTLRALRGAEQTAKRLRAERPASTVLFKE